ncbi:MAG: hypothetical protein WBB69_00830 [Anaerolineales bacterium]
MKRWIILVFVLLFMLSACGPSEADMHATVTQVAAELYGTQTALAPTATSTSTPSITPTPSETPTPTMIPTITNTPLPPTATLREAGVEKLLLCYKAAVSVQADWAVHSLIFFKVHSYSDKKYQELNAFLWERSHRSGGIRIFDKNPFPLGNDTLVVDGVQIESQVYGREDCDPYLGTIIGSAGGLRNGPWGVGAGSRISHSRSIINTAVSKMRKELHEVYGIYNVVLDGIEDPFWLYVHNRYGVELPSWLQ